MQWTKEKFIEDLHKNAPQEVLKISETLCDFAEENADEVAWGRGSDYGTVSFRTNSDFGLISLYLLTSRGKIKFHINAMRQKNLPKPVLKDYLIKLESNFLMDFDVANYPSDILEDIGELFTTSTQLTKFKQCIEGIVYRLKQ